jgi:hypothetical protein
MFSGYYVRIQQGLFIGVNIVLFFYQYYAMKILRNKTIKCLFISIHKKIDRRKYIILNFAIYTTMADVTDMLKAELGVKSNEPHHHHHHHHHDKIIVPNIERTENVTHELQSQLGQGKEIDREIQQEKNQTEGK